MTERNLDEYTTINPGNDEKPMLKPLNTDDYGIVDEMGGTFKSANKTNLNLYAPITAELYTGQNRESVSKYDEGISYSDALSETGFESRRHEQQGGLASFGSALNQAITGEIVGGTIEGIGYLLDLPQYANLIKGTEKEFGNMLSDAGRAIKDFTKESTPIYSDPFKEGEFAPEDWTWWMSNLPSVASTLSLMVPAGGLVKGLSYGAEALNLGSKLTQSSKWLAKGLTQAVASRHMENIMEAAVTMQGVSQELDGQLVGDKQADYIKKNYGIELQKQDNGYLIDTETAESFVFL